jgi:uncharacterized membrane protein YkoI
LFANWFRVLIVCLLSSGIAQIGDAEAAKPRRGAQSANVKAQESLISRDRASAIARSATGGRVLNINLMQGKRPQYRVKVLVNGNRVRTLGVDARSGAIIK